MKTLLFLLARYPGCGGIETVTTVLANNLANRYRVILCSLSHDHRQELQKGLDERVVWRALPNHVQYHDEENIRLFHDIVEREHVDVIINQDSYFRNEYVLESLAVSHKLKLITAEHNTPNLVQISIGLETHACPWWNLYRRLKILLLSERILRKDRERRGHLYDISDSYVLLSDKFREQFAENSTVTDFCKLCAIANPLSFPRPAADWQRKEKRVLFVGQFVGIKGVDRLLRIWHRIGHLVPEWRLTLVGDGPRMPEIRKQICDMGITRVDLPGFSPNVQEYYISAQVLCLCSDFEGFPMVLPEAMSCGVVPVVFNSFAALEDIITDGEDGISVAPYDEEAFAQRLLTLMQQDSLRERMAQAAVRKSYAFDAAVISQQWADLIERIG